MANIFYPGFSKRTERAVNAHAERSRNRSAPLQWPEPYQSDVYVTGPDGPVFRERVWCIPEMPQVSRYQMNDECHYAVRLLSVKRGAAAEEVMACDTSGWVDLAVENRIRYVEFAIKLERVDTLFLDFHHAKYDYCPELIQKFYRECLHPDKFDALNFKVEVDARMEKWVRGLNQEMTIAWQAIPGGAEGNRVPAIATHWLRRTAQDREHLRQLILWDEKEFPIKLMREICRCEKPFIRRGWYVSQTLRLVRCTQCYNVFAFSIDEGWANALPDGRHDIQMIGEPVFVPYSGE